MLVLRFFQRSYCKGVQPAPANSTPLPTAPPPLLETQAPKIFASTKDWFATVSSSKRQAFFDWLRKNKRPILSGIIVTSFVSFNYYRNHLQKTPITNRSRFIALTEEQFSEVCRSELAKIRETFKDRLLPAKDPRTKRVVYVLSRLVSRNKSVPEVNRLWQVAVIESDEKHAKSISTGYIFISTGLLNYVANDDQLGILLSHEMAHALLEHDLEKVSWAMLMQTLWQGLTSILAGLSPMEVRKLLDAMKEKIVEITSNLPYGRLLEREADELGLQLAARACFDPQEAYAYWAGFSQKASFLGNNMNPILAKWIYHHPNYGDRSQRIETLMEQMCDIRRKAGCPPLAKCDPCALLETKRKLGHMDEAMAKEGCPL